MTQNDFVPPYPLFLSLRHFRCLVVGLGEVGQRKLAGLLVCKPEAVLVMDTVPYEALSSSARALLADPCVRYICRTCILTDITQSDIVFAATGDPGENRRIADLCKTARVLCNCVSDPAAGNVALPSVVRHESMTLALSTGGASPALARRWKGELQDWLTPRSRIVRLMGRLRPLVLAMETDTVQNTALFRKIANSPLQEWLATGELEQCRLWLLEHLPRILHAHIAELLDDKP